MTQAALEARRLEVALSCTKATDLYLLYASIDILEESVANLRAMAGVARIKYEVGQPCSKTFSGNVELPRNNQLSDSARPHPGGRARITPS